MKQSGGCEKVKEQDKLIRWGWTESGMTWGTRVPFQTTPRSFLLKRTYMSMHNCTQFVYSTHTHMHRAIRNESKGKVETEEERQICRGAAEKMLLQMRGLGPRLR